MSVEHPVLALDLQDEVGNHTLDYMETIKKIRMLPDNSVIEGVNKTTSLKYTIIKNMLSIIDLNCRYSMQTSLTIEEANKNSKT